MILLFSYFIIIETFLQKDLFLIFKTMNALL